MELFAVNILLVLFCTQALRVTPAVATSISSSQPSTVPLDLRIPSFPVISLSLVLNTVELLGLTPLAHGAFTRSPTKLRIVLVMVSLAEVGHAAYWFGSVKPEGQGNSFTGPTRAFGRYASPDFSRIIHYGELKMILEIIMPENHWFQDRESRRFLLAIVSDCDTNGKDATRELVTFTTKGLSAIVDLNAISVTARYFKFGSVEEKWAVVDRSTGYARTDFKEDDVELSNNED